MPPNPPTAPPKPPNWAKLGLENPIVPHSKTLAKIIRDLLMVHSFLSFKCAGRVFRLCLFAWDNGWHTQFLPCEVSE